MIRLFKKTVLFVALSTCVSAAWADEEKKSEENQDESERNVFQGAVDLVDETHGKVSERFSRFIVQVDDFIGVGEEGEQLNTSWARIRVDTVKPGAEDVKFAANVKLRIVLPQSQQRFRLLLSTEDDQSSAANTDAAQREQIAAEETNDVALALRFIRTAQDRFQLNYDIGARYRDDKAQLFGRLNIGYKREFVLGFTNNFSNSFTYFSASGFENRFRIDSRRVFFDRDRLFFRNSFEVSWREGNKGAAIGDTIGLYASLGKRKALAFEGITGYATALNEGVSDRFRGVEARIRFRHSIWRPWFYYEIWPSVSWSSSNNYEQAYGGLFRIEVTLGNI